jgi:pyruvate/2-oxoglutarate dehydrogenase complex dihydrolipoamide acyltransferase (E2) component
MTAQHGHAIEARICAEDPAADFAPAPGTIVLFDLPGGPGVRVDSGVALGTALPAEFDPLIAKVMAHAPTRAAALARLSCALDELRLVLAGGASNKGLLLDLLDSDALRRGGVDVEWLDRTLPALPPPAHGAQALIAAAILVYQEERATARLNFFAEAMSGAPRTIPDSGGLSVELAHRGAAYRLHVLAIGDWSYRIALDGRECVARLLEAEPHACQLVLGGDRYRLTVARTEGGMRLEVNSRPHLIGRDTGGLVRAAAPAVVIALDVAVGDRVEAGQRLGLLETMKVEVGFHAPFAGTVAALPVRCTERAASRGAVVAHIQPAGRRATTTGDAPRLVLPDWDDALLPLFDGAGRRDLRAAAAAAPADRQRGLGAFGAAVRRVLLGYDQRPDIDAQLRAVLEAPLPDGLDLGFLSALAEVRGSIAVFADTEVLFSRQPEPAAGGAAAPSNDAWLRLYLRRTRARGAGLPERFLGLLRRALDHYGCADLDPGEALERALLRLFAAQARSSERYRLVGDLLRFVTGLAAAGVDLSDDAALAGALGTCIALRGTVPDALADQATEARYTIFERPAIRLRAARATAQLERALAALARPGAQGVNLHALARFADSPPEVFERIAAWATDGATTRREVALQALLLREYAPRVPAGAGAASTGLTRPARRAVQAARCRLDYGTYGVVRAALAPAHAIGPAWDALCDDAAAEAAPPLLELFITSDAPIAAGALQALVESLVARRPPRARRLCCTALQPDGSRAHVTYLDDGDGPTRRDDCLGLHPETARRLDLARLAEFARAPPAPAASMPSTDAAGASRATSASSSWPTCAPRCRALRATCTSRPSCMPSARPCVCCAPTAASATSGAGCTGTASRWWYARRSTWADRARPTPAAIRRSPRRSAA